MRMMPEEGRGDHISKRLVFSRGKNLINLKFSRQNHVF
jgi:hypothetical protein